MADAGVITLATDEAELPPDAPPDGSSSDAAVATPPRRLLTAHRWFLLTLALAVGLVLVIGVRAAADGWLPLGDDGYFALRSHDVFSRHPPLVGTASSASTYSGAPTSHPGPLQFFLLAIPVALLGVSAGTVVGTALVNAVAIGCAGWMVGRRLGPAAGALIAVAFSGLAWAMGSVLLHDVWGPFAVVLPFGLFVVAVALAAGGDVKALPVVAIAGSMVLQTHASYVVLVPGLGLAAFAGALLSSRRTGSAEPTPGPALPADSPPPVERRATLRWIGIGLVTVLLCWVPPLVQQVRNEPGNIGALFRAARADSPATVTVQEAAYLVSGTVALPPWWFPPGFERASPIYVGMNPDVVDPVANIALAALVALMVLAFWNAWRRRDRLVLGFLGTAVVGLLLGFASVLRAPAYGVWAASYTRFLWPLSLLAWFSLGLAATRAVLARRATRPSREGAWLPRVGRAVLPVTSVAVVAIAVFAVPHRDNVVADREAWQETAPPLIDAVMEAVDGVDGPVMVMDALSQPNFTYGPMLLAEFAEHDVDFLVEGPTLARQAGGHRSPRPGHEPAAELWILPTTETTFDGELVYFESGLPAAEEADMLAATAQLEEEGRTRGRLHLSPEARDFVNEHLPNLLDDIEGLLVRQPLTPRIMRDAGNLTFGRPLLWDDGGELDRDLVVRWAKYDTANVDGSVAVYLRRLSPAPPAPPGDGTADSGG